MRKFLLIVAILFPAIATAQPDLSGEWVMNSVNRDGRDVTRFAGEMRRVTQGDTTTVYRNGGLHLQSRFVQTANTLDFDVLQGEDAGRRMYCNYALNGDTLTLSYSAGGRPAGLSTGKGVTYSTWKRVKTFASPITSKSLQDNKLAAVGTAIPITSAPMLPKSISGTSSPANAPADAVSAWGIARPADAVSAWSIPVKTSAVKSCICTPETCGNCINCLCGCESRKAATVTIPIQSNQEPACVGGF